MIKLFGRGTDLKTLGFLLILLMLAFTFLLPGEFLTLANFQSMAFQLPELGLLAIAMATVMLTGGIDLSIISTANMFGLVVAGVMTKFILPGAGSGQSLVIFLLAFLAGLLVAAVIGLVNGLIIAYIGVSPILATLGTMTVVEGISVLSTRGRVISGFPEFFQVIGNGDFAGIPIPFILFLLAAWVVGVLLERTPWGLAVYMIGSNQVATEFSGINIRKVVVKAYMLSALLAGVSSLIMISRFNSAKAGYGASYLLVTVLACVLGGLNPDGGFGNIAGLMLGLGSLQVMSSGLNLLGFSAHLTVALWGAIILLVLFVRRFRSQGGKRVILPEA